MNEEIREILDFLRSEATKKELIDDFNVFNEKVEKLLIKNEEKMKRTSNDILKKLLNREREVLLEVRKVARLIRLEKIIRLIGRGERPKNLTEEERKLLKMMNEVLEARFTERREKREVIAVAVRDIPAFVGTSGSEYGPFKQGDVIKILEEDLRILIKRGFVKVVGENEYSKGY